MLPPVSFSVYGERRLECKTSRDITIFQSMLPLDGHFSGSGGNDLVFCILDLIIHPAKPISRVRFAFDIVLIVLVEGINVIHQPCFYVITLPKLLFMRCDLLLNGIGIQNSFTITRKTATTFYPTRKLHFLPAGEV